MTIKQIAEITGKSIHTIHRAVKKRFPNKDVLSGSPIDLSEMESYLILKGLHPGYDLLPPSQNEKVPSQNAKLPNGSQLREMRLMVKERILSTDHVRSLLGLVPSQSSDKPALSQPEKKTVYLPSLPTKEEQADQIVGHRVRAKQTRKIEDHKTQIRLFEDGI